jgi:hypothetical protein
LTVCIGSMSAPGEEKSKIEEVLVPPLEGRH